MLFRLPEQSATMASQTQLFRKTACAGRLRAISRAAPLPLPPGSRAYTALLSGLALTLLLFLALGHYTPKDTVRGYVLASGGDVEVYSQSDGTIIALNVVEGQAVQRGDTLMTLSTARSLGQDPSTRARIERALENEQEELEKQRQRELEAFHVEARSVRAEIASLNERIERRGTQRQVLLSGLRLAEKSRMRLARLDNDAFVAASDVDAADASTIEYRLRLDDVDVSIASLRADLESAERRSEALPLRRDARMAELDAQAQRLAAAMAEQSSRRSQRLIAPATGIVSGILVQEGQTISTTNPILNIVPGTTEFRVELLIPPDAIASVHAGAAIRLRYDAYPYQRFGTFDGVIVNVARTTVLPSDKRFHVPVAGAVYLATASLDPQQASVTGAPVRLQSGMALTADILRERRRIYEWLFAPLIGAGRRLH
jgi:membrane fusion protein